MELKEIADNVYACLQEDKGFGWNNAGYINLGEGVIVDTLYDVKHTREMVELIQKINPNLVKRIINTHHNGDHTWGNQLFKDREIIAHQYTAKYMEEEKKRNLPGLLQTSIKRPHRFPEGMKWFIDEINEFDFSDVEITLPNHLIEDNLTLELDGFPCDIIYVGPAHSAGDLIVNLPEHKVLFSGDIIFSKTTPLGWEGTHENWIKALDLIKSLEPKVIVPGHGPLCDLKAVEELRDYFEFIYSEAKKYFDEGLSPLEASKMIDLGLYKNWNGTQRLIFNVNRAFREFEGTEPWDSPFNEIELISKGHELRTFWEKED